MDYRDYFIEEMDKKLRELMTLEDYIAFSASIAKEFYRKLVDDMPESDFKDYIKEHFDEITK